MAKSLSSIDRKSLKVTAAKAIKIQNALDLLETHFADVIKIWGRAKPHQRKALRKNSPTLDQTVEFAHKFAKNDKDEE